MRKQRMTPEQEGARGDVLHTFAEDVVAVLKTDADPLLAEEVLRGVLHGVRRDLRLISGFPNYAHVTVGEFPLQAITLPLPAADSDYIHVADFLDTHMKGKKAQLPLSEEYESLGSVRDNTFYAVGLLLHRHFGDDAVDLNFEIMLQCLKRDNKVDSPELLSKMAHATPKLKKNYLAFFSQEVAFDPEDKKILDLLVGPSRSAFLLKKEGTVAASLDVITRTLATHKTSRAKMLRAIESFVLAPQALLANAIARKGYETLGDMEEVTDYEWWQKLKKVFEKKHVKKKSGIASNIEDAIWNPALVEKVVVSELGKNADTEKVHPPSSAGSLEKEGEPPDIAEKSQPAKSNAIERIHLDQVPVGKMRMTDEAGKRLEAVVLEGVKMFADSLADELMDADDFALLHHANIYLRNHLPDAPLPIRDVINAQKYRRELHKMRWECNTDAQAAKEREIVDRVFGAAMRYVHDEERGEETQTNSFLHGTPVFASEHKTFNCFSGPWFIAQHLMECGIRYDQILFCSANEAGNIYGTHGALMILLSNGENIFVDHGFKKLGRPFVRKFASSSLVQNQLKVMMENSKKSADRKKAMRCEPIQVSLDRNMAQVLEIYGHFHLMPLDQGICAGHLLNTGIAFVQEGKRDEAKRAFKLGLISFPQSPDLLCRLGILAMEEDDLQTASEYLHAACIAYPGHLQAQYYTGIFYLKTGDQEGAMELFKSIAEDEREIWGDDNFKKHATALVQKHEELQKAREECAKDS